MFTSFCFFDTTETHFSQLVVLFVYAATHQLWQASLHIQRKVLVFLIYSIVMFCVTSETSCEAAAVVSNLSDRNGEDGNFSGRLVY